MTRSEFLRRLGMVATAVIVGGAPAMAEPRPVSGPAAAAIGTFLKDTSIACFMKEGDGATCPIADIGVVSRVDYGVFTGHSVPVAVAFVDYQDDPSGQMVKMMAVVFREDEGRWTPVGRVSEIIGRNPHAVRFGSGTIRYEGGIVADDGSPAQRSFILNVWKRGVTFAAAEDQ